MTTIDRCPSCGSVNWSVTGSDGASSSVTIGSETFQQPAFRVGDCAMCGLLFKTATLCSQALRRYYELVDYRKWEMVRHQPPERVVLKFLRTLPDRSRILDFGCSSGRLLSEVAASHECYGLEVNTEAAEVAARNGLRIVTAADLPQLENHLDAVVMSDVFEHLRDPTDVLTRLFRLLKGGGQLIVMTGNGDAAACRRDPAKFWYFQNPEHVCMLTRRYAAFLGEKCRGRLWHWKELSRYDLPLLPTLKHRVQTFAYWESRRGSPLKKVLLSGIPLIRRARHWLVPPSFPSSRDHVVVIFSKLGEM